MAIYKAKKATKDGRQWFFRIKYKDIYGNQKDYTSPKYKLKNEAIDSESKYRIRLHLNSKIDIPKSFDKLFYEYIDRKDDIKIQTKQKLLTLYENHLSEILKNISLDKISIDLYEKIKNMLLNKGLSVKYSNKVLGIIDQVNKYSKKYYGVYSNVPDIVGKNKMKNEIKKEMSFFTFEEYELFSETIDSLLWKTFFEFLYFIGSRQGETTALNWKDINFFEKKVKINKTLTTKIKGEKWSISSPKTKSSVREIPIPNKLLEDLKKLKEYYKSFVNYSDTWFVFGGVRPLPETTIQKKKNYYCKKAGVKQIRIHDFRHSCASLLINKGASIALVSKYLGHGDISITLNTYTHMYQSELENMTNILNKL